MKLHEIILLVVTLINIPLAIYNWLLYVRLRKAAKLMLSMIEQAKSGM